MAKNARLKEFESQMKEQGYMSDYLFASTFEMYVTQMQLCERLAQKLEALSEDEAVVYKKYGGAGGSANVYANPLYNEYSKACQKANMTMSALAKLKRSIKAEMQADEKARRDEKGGRLEELMRIADEG
jgi:hypothetical protein